MASLYPGMTVMLRACTGGHLMIDANGNLSALVKPNIPGTDRFRVIAGNTPNTVKLQCMRNSQHYIQINKHRVSTGHGKGGKYTEFTVHEYGNNVIALGSVMVPGSFLSIGLNGLPLGIGVPPQQHDIQFTAFPLPDQPHVPPPSNWMPTQNPHHSPHHPPHHSPHHPPHHSPHHPPHHSPHHPPHHSPQQQPHRGLYIGRRGVHLMNETSKKNLRIQANGAVDGMGGTGNFATFDVVAGTKPGTIKLQNHHNRAYHLRIDDRGNCDGRGGAGPYTDFVVVNHSNNHVSLQSALNPKWHVGINNDGSIKDPKQTGVGAHAQFRIC